MLDKEKYKIRYKTNLEKFNMQITEIEKTTKKYRYIEKLKNKMEEGFEIIGIENASTESLDRYIELSDLEKDLKSVYDKQKEAIYTFMIDTLDSKIGLFLKIHPNLRLWECMCLVATLVNFIICLIIEFYLSGWSLLLWIILDILVFILLYGIAKKQYNSMKRELLRCIDKCIPYKEY